MGNVNKVLLMGNLTRDPEIRYTPSGAAVCEFGLAVNRSYTAKDGQKHDETCFVDITVWGKRGLAAAEYLRKGDPLFVEGRLQYQTWEAKGGGRRSKISVVCEDFQFIGKRRDSSEGVRESRTSVPENRTSSEDLQGGLPVADGDIPF